MTDSFVSRMEQEIENRKTDVFHLRVIAERAYNDPDKQNEYYRIIEEIVIRKDAVREKLAEYRAAHPDTRPALRKEVEEMWLSTEEAIEVAKAKMLEY